MTLTGAQVETLVAAIEQNWDLPGLSLFLSDELDLDLAKVAPDGSLQLRTLAAVTHLITSRPPRDVEFLQKLGGVPSAALRALSAQLLTPTYYAPTGQPMDAILLGRMAFVDRMDLRDRLREFVAPSEFTTRMLVVRGEKPSGKSYTWNFLRHLARSAGAEPRHLELYETGFTPRDVVSEALSLLGLRTDDDVVMTDSPQLAHMSSLVNLFVGRTAHLTTPFWLVIDDLNDDSVLAETRELAFALARAVENVKAPNLWIALLGYNSAISDFKLRYIAQDDAQFPDESLLAQHLIHVAAAGPNPLDQALATKYAQLLLAKNPPTTKAAMQLLTMDVERMGELLRRGDRP